ncbi:MAG: hypothetical protein GWN00_01520 [Aliifodinibius sp.]|nr:hypothetical protein [Phycisphaerae bacterium]NIR62357.1 hypothetical protein [candidate division Zixibacteria bacterium]NIT54957.1 hypothetical protein [Fodinibius sp.]NIW43368.1 hypothetical protein [Gammaproteobacteria bacterium]NIU12590.1 hypothetical protein [candidate division Zixibacteria bacterium]
MKINTTIKIQGQEFTGIVTIDSYNIDEEYMEDFLAGEEEGIDEIRSWVDHKMGDISKVKASYKNGSLVATYSVGRGLKAEIELDYSSMATSEDMEDLDKESIEDMANELILATLEITKVEAA